MMRLMLSLVSPMTETKVFFFTGSKHQLMQTNVVLTALHSLNGCTIGAALGKVFTSVPRAIVCTCGISVIKVKGCRDGNNYLPPVFVLVCRASLDSNSCFLNFWVGRIHLTTLLLYIFLMYHIGTTKYIIPLYKRISNDNITFSI